MELGTRGPRKKIDGLKRLKKTRKAKQHLGGTKKTNKTRIWKEGVSSPLDQDTLAEPT